MSILGFEFTIKAHTHIQTSDEAKALIAQFLLPNTKIAIHNIEYDYLGGSYESRTKPISSEIKGTVWMDT